MSTKTPFSSPIMMINDPKWRGLHRGWGYNKEEESWGLRSSPEAAFSSPRESRCIPKKKDSSLRTSTRPSLLKTRTDCMCSYELRHDYRRINILYYIYCLEEFCNWHTWFQKYIVGWLMGLVLEDFYNWHLETPDSAGAPVLDSPGHADSKYLLYR